MTVNEQTRFSPFEEKVLSTIERYGMFNRGDVVLVAASGGADSTALSHLLTRTQHLFDLKLYLFHLDHRMRPQSAEDASFVRKLADELGLPYKICLFDVPAFVAEKKISAEEGARKIRYRFLEQVAREIQAKKIALAHHADDQVETYLMRLLQGAGSGGLRGIPAARGLIVRPFMDVTKKEILEYCWQRKLKFRRDRSNLDPRFFRNKVRLHLVPMLEEYNPSFRKNILRTIDILETDDSYLEQICEKEFGRTAKVSDDIAKISVDKIKRLPVALQRRIIRRGIKLVNGDLRGIEFKHVDLVLDHLARGDSKLALDVTRDLTIFREYDTVIIAKRDTLKVPELSEVMLDVPGVTKLPAIGLRVEARFVKAKDLEARGRSDKTSTASFDLDMLAMPLSVRFPRAGDRFVPLGMGEKKKLQDFFVDEKIPVRTRKRTPLVVSNGQIVWLVGMRIDDRFKITENTNNALVLKVEEQE